MREPEQIAKLIEKALVVRPLRTTRLFPAGNEGIDEFVGSRFVHAESEADGSHACKEDYCSSSCQYSRIAAKSSGLVPKRVSTDSFVQ